MPEDKSKYAPKVLVEVDEKEELKKALKWKRATETAIRKKWSTSRSEMIEGRKDSMQESLSAYMTTVNAIRLSAVQTKEHAKATRDHLVEEAKTKYGRAEEEIAMERDIAIDEAKQECKKRHDALREALEKDTQPHKDKHKTELEEVEEDFKKEMKNIDQAEAKALIEVKAEIVELEEKLKGEKVKPPKKAA